MKNNLTIIDHPMLQHKLGYLRDKHTSTNQFRRLLREISQLLAYEVTRNLQMTTRIIETPLGEMEVPVFAGKKNGINFYSSGRQWIIGRHSGLNSIRQSRVCWLVSK